MNIGHRLESLLEEEGITQKELANTLNLSATTLNGYIKNRRQPDANTLVRLASYFNTTTDYLYGVTSLREAPTAPFNADERHLINIYRTIPEDKKPLFIETGKLFSGFDKNRLAEGQAQFSKTKNRVK
ncbi:MAG: helix-turn-helix transcriptional regulator [Lachnospiraceae bacterium]|nr:helix-turn-helix transcriptional regulator [Lachnospiraceae bacterium]